MVSFREIEKFIAMRFIKGILQEERQNEFNNCEKVD